jgi:pantoate kinase
VAVKTILHYKLGELPGDRVFGDSLKIKLEHINIVDNVIKLTSHRSRIPIANGFGGRKGFMQRELVCEAHQKRSTSKEQQKMVFSIY